MKILETKILRGPNYWSNYRQQLIQMKIDLGVWEQLPTNLIEGFSERIETTMPSLYSHHCSEGHEGGFFERIKEGTWLGHVIEHVALELQCLAGMECSFGRTRSAGPEGQYYVIFSYHLEEAGLYAGKAAVQLVQKLAEGETYSIENDVRTLSHILYKKGLGPSTSALVNEARKRKIPVTRLDNDSLILLGYGAHQKKIRASITSETSNIGVELAGDKEATKKILANAYIPVPKGILVTNGNKLKSAIRHIGFPLVIKPIDGNHGRGITTHIQNYEQAYAAYKTARLVSNQVIVERFLEGHDFRFLVINYKVAAVALRTPAMVTGNGRSTIQELIDETNRDPQRGESHEKVMTRIRIDSITEKILAEKNFTLQTVLPPGEILYLKYTANMSTGGTATDVTDAVHPQNIFMAERAARLLNLDVCGLDVIAKDISQPLTSQNGGILEINASPGLRMHLAPSKGLARNVAEPLIDMLFPKGKPSRIPLIAITGTNGKTTTTRLVAHLAKTAGHHVGFTTTDGIYIHDQIIFKGDCTGSQSAKTILTDPTVDFAVLECARGGILRSGLGFDHCDISIITNVASDHLGLGGIDTIEDMARVKSVVARSTYKDGYCILNADDDLVYEMREDISCNIALFSMHSDNPRIIRHCENGGLAAIIEKGYLTVCKGDWRIRVSQIAQVPLSFGGRAECMIKNIMPAVLAGVIRNFRIEDIRTALQTFIPSPEQTPGRFNIFNFRDFDIMIDYAHNPAGFIELKKFLDYTAAQPKIGIITAVGDRRDEDIRMTGFLCAQMFDKIIIRHDTDLRGRPREEINQLLLEGMHQYNPQIQHEIISDEVDALKYAMNTAPYGSFITLLSEKTERSINFLRKAQEKEKKNNDMITHDSFSA